MPRLPACALLLAMASTGASANDFLKKTVEDLRHAAKQVAPIVAPGLTVVIAVAQGQKPGDAIKNTVLAPAKITVDGMKVTKAIDDQIEEEVKKIVGPGAVKVIEVVRLPENIQQQIPIQIGDTLLNSADSGKIDPAKFAAVPFAALLQQAIDLYEPRAKAIPPTVQTLLKTVHDKATLESARFVVDDNLGSLPGAINFIREKSADNFAVTVGNIIVFARDPGLSDVHFWAHELQHTVQYRTLKVDGFAAKYALHSAEMEAEAEEAGRKADVQAPIILSFLRAQQADAAQH